MATPYQMLMVTVPDQKTAETIADGLLKQRLAACVNISGNVQSRYWDKGKIETQQEFIMFIKTRESIAADATIFIKSNHPYNVPEVIAFDIVSGLKSYLDFIGANCKIGETSARPPKNYETEKKQ